jgi:hypothetical protein
MGRTFNKISDTGDFVLAPEGTSTAVLVCLAYLGKHESTYNGETRIRELLGLSYELSERGEDGRALAVQEVMTASLHEKSKFFPRVLALCGGKEPLAGFDLAGLLGRGCVITIGHVQKDGRTYANVLQVGALPRGLSAPAPSVAPVYFDMAQYDPATYERLPKRFQKLGENALGDGYIPPSAAPAPSAPAAWGGSHAAQAPAWPSQAPRQPAPLPASPADSVPFDDDIPF